MTDTATLTRVVDGVEIPIAGSWSIDPAHTSVEFVARHLMVTKVRGRFTDVSGGFEIAEDPADSQVQVTIDAASITTGDADRNAHLRSGDFLETDRFPHLAFRSTDLRRASDGWKMDGELTIKDVTRPVTLHLEYLGVTVDPWGNPKAAFSASTSIDREDFGLTWNVALEAGGVLVGKKVTIEIEVQAAPAAE